MHTTGQHESSRHISHQAFRNPGLLASFCKRTLIIVSYATACAVVPLAMAYWPASAGNVLTEFNVLRAHLSSASDVSNRIHKADRLSGGGDKSRRETPQAERHIEKIPFGCDSAFGRLVTKGNFSTRCIAGLETLRINT
jgi:hypothetical protein